MARTYIISLLLVALLCFITSTFGMSLEGRRINCDGPHPSCENCCGNFCCGPEDDCIGGRCRAPPAPPPQPVKDMGMLMQYQESDQWCWIAVATSVNHFYSPGSGWTQCAVMNDVGHRVNGFDPNTSVCPTSMTLFVEPTLASALADPYSTGALYILDSYTTGVDREYLKSGGVSDPLVTTGNFGSIQGAGLSITAIASEINAGRPVVVSITFTGGANHFVTISGIASDYLSVLILDPIYGRTIMKWNDFPAHYQGGATVDAYVFTIG